MRQFFYGVSFVAILFIAIWARGEAQGANCDTTLAEVRTLVAQAKTALDNGDTTTASALLSGAQAILNSAAQTQPTPAGVLQQAEVAIGVATTAVTTTDVTTTASTFEQPATTPTVSPQPTQVAMIADGAAPNAKPVNAPAVENGSSVVFLHFVNTSIDSGPIDIYMKNNDQPIVENLAFGEYTTQATFRSGAHVFIMRPAGSGAGGEELYRMKWDFNGNSTWMVIAAGLKTTYSFIVEPVTIIRSNLNNGKARVRVVNWVSGGERLSVSTSTGVQLAKGLGWVGVADKEIDPGTYTLNVSTVSGALQGDGLTMDFQPNTVYVLLITGGKDGNPKVSLMNIVSPRDTTRVRFINNRSEALDIHARPSNEKLIADFAPGQTSEFISLPSGAMTFIGYLPGTGPRGQEKGGVSVQLRPGHDFTISITANGSMEVIETGLTP
jgi:hypothetical protein